MKNTQPTHRKAQAGVMLLEALIAILIFSLGILSLVALQGTSIQLTSDAKYRTDASMLANKLIGQMWASGGTATDLAANFASPDGKDYKTWRDQDVKATNSLPGIVAEGEHVKSTLPTVRVVEVKDAAGKPPPGATAATVEITIFWRTPQMKAEDDGHRHVVTTQIVFPNQ